MHFRIRKNVIQLVRGVYDPSKKKGMAQVIGSVKLDHPHLDEALSEKLTEEERQAFSQWVVTLLRTEQLKAELAALTLTEQMTMATSWFEAQPQNDCALTERAMELVKTWQALRKTLARKGYLD
jgi:hypothetical protein